MILITFFAIVVSFLDKLTFTKLENEKEIILRHKGKIGIVRDLNCASPELMFLLIEDSVINVLEIMLHINFAFVLFSSLTRYL